MDVAVDERAPLVESRRSDLLGGVTTIEAAGLLRSMTAWAGRLYRPLGDVRQLPSRPVKLTAIPYYAWANRGPHAMRVWIPCGESG
jgi:DUF1680 family protein